MLTVTVQRSLINISKKAATGWELTQTKKQQTLYFDCAKHINYKKIYIYMYIQQTILCKHGKYVSFSEKHGVINTGNIGIRKDHKKVTFWAVNTAHRHRNQGGQGFENAPHRTILS